MAKRILINFVNNLFCCIKLGTSVQPSCTDVLSKQHRKQSLETYKTIRKRFLIVFFRPFQKNTAFGRLRVVVYVLKLCFLCCSRRTSVQLGCTLVPNFIQQNKLLTKLIKILLAILTQNFRNSLDFFTKKKTIKVVNFDPFVLYLKIIHCSTNFSHRPQMM